jgi:hypothetical protein
VQYGAVFRPGSQWTRVEGRLRRLARPGSTEGDGSNPGRLTGKTGRLCVEEMEGGGADRDDCALMLLLTQMPCMIIVDAAS